MSQDIVKTERALFDAAKLLVRSDSAATASFRRVITESEARYALAGLVEMIGGPLTSEQAKDLRTLMYAIIDTYGRDPSDHTRRQLATLTARHEKLVKFLKQLPDDLEDRARTAEGSACEADSIEPEAHFYRGMGRARRDDATWIREKLSELL